MGKFAQIDLDRHRDGATYSPAFDYKRLNRQARAVYDAVSDGNWYSLRQIADKANAPEASVSARLRDFRKAPHNLTVERHRISMGGIWVYRLKETPP